MSQNTLIEKITKDAAVKVADIQAAGAVDISSVKSETDVAVAELKKVAALNLEKKKSQLELVAVSRAKQDGNIAIQTAKRKYIDEIFSEVLTLLQGQTSEEYVTYFTAKCQLVVPSNIKVVSVSAPANRTEETSVILKSLSIEAPVTVDKNLTGGLIFQAEDGVYDVTLKRIFDEQRNALEMQVVNKILS